MQDDGPGEFALIERLLARLGDAAALDILVPPGDDAAIWAGGAAAGATETATVATTDTLVEGTHWRCDTMSLSDAGWRAIAASVSDLAAMGARPGYALVALTLGPSIDADGAEALAEGMAAACRRHHLRVAGGDIVRGGQTSITVTALGTVEVRAGAPLALRRDAARPGDAVAVSGPPGAAAAGLTLIEAGRTHESGAEALIAAHRRPEARLDLGLAAVTAGVACGIDVSDGLLQDAGHVAERSATAIEIDLDALPLHADAVRLLGLEAARDLALGGGEDFELLLTGDADTLRALSTPEVPVTVIGRVIGRVDAPQERGEGAAGSVVVRDREGQRYEPPSTGWDHLRPPAGR